MTGTSFPRSLASQRLLVVVSHHGRQGQPPRRLDLPPQPRGRPSSMATPLPASPSDPPSWAYTRAWSADVGIAGRLYNDEHCDCHLSISLFCRISSEFLKFCSTDELGDVKLMN
uniref:Uncharacterized protein n=1 Tax=Triticum urartu TaxID=4572 RepID=A0A8R7TG26_TRIUA